MYLRVTRSPLAVRQRTLKAELLTTRAELMKTSAQDQFAKWAKLRRSVDKGLADLEKLSACISFFARRYSCLFRLYLFPRFIRRFYPNSHFTSDSQIATAKSGFSMKFNTVLWVLTTGLQFVVGWWYRRQPVFYLPQGWFGPLGWWLALPFAPAGRLPTCHVSLSIS